MLCKTLIDGNISSTVHSAGIKRHAVICKSTDLKQVGLKNVTVDMDLSTSVKSSRQAVLMHRTDFVPGYAFI